MSSDSILQPNVTLSLIPGATITTVEDRRVLIVGQMLTGTATALALTENINSLSNDEVNALFGQTSLVAGMVRRAQTVLNGIVPQPQVDVIPLDDDGGTTNAEAVITFAGTATEAGTITIVVGSETDHSYSVSVADTDTATTVGDSLVTLITADGDAPFTAVNVAGVVTITAENGGTIPNTWGIAFDGSVAGVTTALTAWTGGATDPSLTTVFDAIDDIRETTVIWPGAYGMDVIATEMDSRFNVTNDVLDGVGVSVIADTVANLKSTVSTLNSESTVLFGNTLDTSGGFSNKLGPGILELQDIIATEIGIIRALRLTDTASITQFVNSSGAPNDAFGGIHISSKPYHNTVLPNVPIPPAGQYFNQVDQADLVDNGVSVVGANRASNATILGTVVTTYLTDTAGNSDTSYKFLNTVDQSSVIREFYVNNLRTRYSQSRLTDGAITVGFALENEQSIRGFCVQLFQELGTEQVTQSGNVALQDYKDNLTVTVDVSTGTATINQAPLLVGQLRIIVGSIEVNFG